MTPERWQKVKTIFNSAIQYLPEERKPFLSEACSGDPSLRNEVDSLLAWHEKTGEFIDDPAYVQAPWLTQREIELTDGQSIGTYTILSLIGCGGMGEVYLAHDRRLNRKVALKVLPASFTKDRDRLSRFKREAQAASALNHPNIITIYDIQEVDSTHIIATEFVEGETLRERLSRSAPSLSETLNIAIQVADAVSAAHKAGIIHRDIKPENVMIRPDGYVKVLDFGLAKSIETKVQIAGPDDSTKRIATGSGIILGTIGYMSPEQARAQTIDARSDIFNLGVMLYEMVTGVKPFDGETTSDVLAAILKTDPPPITEYTPDAPPELIRIVNKAIRKDREQRYQVIQDFLLDLKSLKEDIDFQRKIGRSYGARSSGEETPTNSIEKDTTELKSAISTITHSLSVELKSHKRGVVVVLITLIIAAAIGAVMIYRIATRARTDTTEKANVLQTTQITFSTGLDLFPSLSPDGKSVVYSSDRSGNFEIYIKQVAAGGEELQLTKDGQQNLHPAWSPDGQRIAYYSRNRGGIWLMSTLGGNPKQLTEFGAKPSWSPDGSMIAFQSGLPSEVAISQVLAPSTIWIVSSGGGRPRQVSQTGTPAGGHNSPSWSPDGKRIVFEEADYLKQNVWSVGIDGGDTKKIVEGSRPVYGPDGSHLYFVGEYNGGLMRIKLSASGDPIGEAVQLAPAGPGVQFGNPSISPDGRRIFYSANRIQSNLWTIPLSAQKSEPTGPPTTFSPDTSQRSNLGRFSPDGHKFALNRWRPGTSADIWVSDEHGQNLVQLTNNPATDSQANWFPTGDKLAFLSDRANKRMALWTISLATGKEELLLDLGDGVQFAQLSPDAKQVAYNYIQNGAINVWTARISDGERKQLTFGDRLMGFPCWSPDSQHIAYEWQQGQDDQIMVMPAAGGQSTQLTFDHGKSWPHSWSGDGDKIAFAGLRDGVWNVYWVSLSTKAEKQLTHYTKLNTFVRYPAWSPSGNQIVYEYAEFTGNIWMMELE
jgi:Tol biopolymer transport system component